MKNAKSSDFAFLVFVGRNFGQLTVVQREVLRSFCYLILIR